MDWNINKLASYKIRTRGDDITIGVDEAHPLLLAEGWAHVNEVARDEMYKLNG